MNSDTKEGSEDNPSGETKFVSNIQRLAALRAEAQNNWKKRVSKNDLDDGARKKSDTSGIHARLSKLDESSVQWRSRVEQTDVFKFTISHRMSSSLELKNNNTATTQHQTTTNNNPHQQPPPDTVGRIIPIVEEEEEDTIETEDTHFASLQKENFDGFFAQHTLGGSTQNVEIPLLDFDKVARNLHNGRLVFKKNVPFNRKQKASSNPIRNLYKTIEIKTDIYSNTQQSLQEVEDTKISLYKESLSRFLQDFDNLKSNALKKAEPISYEHPILIQIKGRRRPIVKLVRPITSNVNRGDDFLLVTLDKVFHYQAVFSNVIERAVACEMATYVINNRDMGISKHCQLFEVTEDSAKRFRKDFWLNLGGNEDSEPQSAGNPDEDILFESCLMKSIQVFEVCGEDLRPLDDWFGRFPKYSLLEHDKVLVFDFGSELYLWMGKNANSEIRQTGSKLLEERWKESFDADNYDICPITLHAGVKTRKRPSWGICHKVTQNLESILFKEKFSEWPDPNRQSSQSEEVISMCNFSPCDVTGCDVTTMLDFVPAEPCLVLEMTNLGRGVFYHDLEDRRMFNITTTSVKMWHVEENEKKCVDEESLGFIDSHSTYVVKWSYRVVCSGRTLKGAASKHQSSGRLRTAYFFWQGASSSISDKGTCALMTVEVKEECGPQIRVPMYSEPPAFLNLFQGGLVIFSKSCQESHPLQRMFLVRGELQSEAHLIEVPLSPRHLRSRGCLVLVDIGETVTLYIWTGCKAPSHLKDIATYAAQKFASSKSEARGWNDDRDVSMEQCPEGSEGDQLKCFFTDWNDMSLLEANGLDQYTPKFWKVESLTEHVELVPVLSSYRSDNYSPLPIFQEALYETTQPALFIIDVGDRIWVWQGWWPEELEHNFPTESAMRHFLFSRLTAYATAVQYAASKSKLLQNEDDIEAELVMAGGEPPEFTNIFPSWNVYPDIENFYQQKEPRPTQLMVKEVFENLSRTQYTVDELTSEDKPEGVDQLSLEKYLTDRDFQQIFDMKRSEFYSYPVWKQLEMKKKYNLF